MSRFKIAFEQSEENISQEGFSGGLAGFILTATVPVIGGAAVGGVVRSKLEAKKKEIEKVSKEIETLRNSSAKEALRSKVIIDDVYKSYTKVTSADIIIGAVIGAIPLVGHFVNTFTSSELEDKTEELDQLVKELKSMLDAAATSGVAKEDIAQTTDSAEVPLEADAVETVEKTEDDTTTTEATPEDPAPVPVDPTGVDTDIPDEPTLAEAAAGASDATDALEDPEEVNADTDILEHKQAMEGAIVSALDAATYVDRMVELKEVVSKINEPTGSELALINIANSLSGGNNQQSTVSMEDFGDIGKAVTDKIKTASTSIKNSVASIFSSFGQALKRIGFAFKSHKAQISKLHGIVDKVLKDGSKTIVDVSVKQNYMLFKSDNTGKVATRITDSVDLVNEVKKLSTIFDRFSNTFAQAVVVQKSRYGDAFRTLFHKEASDVVFMEELNEFNDKFVSKLIDGAGLIHKTKTGLLVTNYSDICLGGVHFEVTTPNESILKEKDAGVALRALDQYSFGPNSFYKDITAGSDKRWDMTIHLEDIKTLLDEITSMITTFELITDDYLVEAVNTLESFTESSVTPLKQNSDGEVDKLGAVLTAGEMANDVFKRTNKIARLQVLEARAIIDAYFNTYSTLKAYIEGTISLVYDVANSKEWYKQDISSL